MDNDAILKSENEGNSVIENSADKTGPEEHGQNGSYDIFISYSSKNKNVADAIVADLEQHGIKCWYAPRDIMPGQEWVSAIKEGIEASKALVLIYTDESNSSRQVMNEVALAFNAGKTIVPFKLTKEQMNSELEYYLTRVHWMDAVSAPLNAHIRELREYLSIILSHPHEEVPKLDGGREKKKKIKKWAIIGVSALIFVFLVGVCFGVSKDYMSEGLAFYNSQYRGSEDNAKAYECFQKASPQNADAYYYLGKIDERNYEYDKAEENYNKGIEAGSNLARIGLGNLYVEGDGVVTDLKKAKELIDKALSNGCIEANYYEGYFSQKGIAGVDADANIALEQLEKVLVSSDHEIVAKAYMLIGDINKNGFAGVKRDVDKSLEYYAKAVEADSYFEGIANVSIGDLHQSCEDVGNSHEAYKKALAFFEKSASMGNIASLNSCGYLYYTGKGTDVDSTKARKYYEKAEEMGSPVAMCNLGILYEYGKSDLTENVEEAFSEYKKSGEAGYAKGFRKVGDLYYHGKIGKSEDDRIDYSEAKKYYELATSYGYADAYALIGDMYLDEQAVFPGKSGKQDEKKALEYYQKGIDMGSSDAMYKEGKYYYLKATDEDDTKALQYFRKAAWAGSGYGMLFMGLMCENGYGVDQDYNEAKEWYLRATENYDAGEEYIASGMYHIGRLYYEGYLSSGKPDYENALDWFDRARDNGSSIATRNLGDMYLNGQGVEKDIELAATYYSEAAEKGDPEANKYMGDYYSYKKDYNKAVEYYSVAAEKNNGDAMNLLVRWYIENDEKDLAIENYSKLLASGSEVQLTAEELFKIGSMFYDTEDYDNSGLAFYNAAEKYKTQNSNDYAASGYYDAGLAYYRVNSLDAMKMAYDCFVEALKYGYDRNKVKEWLDYMVSNKVISAEEAQKAMETKSQNE